MDSRRSGAQSHYMFITADKLLQILFESIHIWAERNHPVCIKGRLKVSKQQNYGKELIIYSLVVNIYIHYLSILQKY